jgi:hypothetical protein
MGGLHLGVVDAEGKFLVPPGATFKLRHAVHPVTEVHWCQPADRDGDRSKASETFQTRWNRNSVLIYLAVTNRSPTYERSSLCSTI